MGQEQISNDKQCLEQKAKTLHGGQKEIPSESGKESQEGSVIDHRGDFQNSLEIRVSSTAEEASKTKTKTGFYYNLVAFSKTGSSQQWWWSKTAFIRLKCK